MALSPEDAHRVPVPVRDLLARLQGAGYRAFLVGGCVRDLIRDTPVLDWDVGTSATPRDVIRLFPGAIPTGLKHGTVTVPLSSGPCEVTTFRIESDYSDARRPDRVTFTDDVERDLARRDFTVNAIAWDPVSGDERDPFGGRADLAGRTLRAVGDPVVRFREDGLRPIRAARFAATLEFDVEPATFEALPRAGEQVARVAAERIKDELMKMLRARQPSRGFEVLRRSGLLPIVLPELAACVAVPQNRYHAFDVYFHTLHTTDAAPAEKPLVRLAALFHDVGKPATRAEKENGDATFYNHQYESARLAETAMTRLRFSRDATDQVVHLVRNHMFDYRPEWTDATVRRFVRTVGPDNVADLFDLRIADNVGNGLKTGFPHYLGELTDRINRVIEAQEALSVRDLKVDGGDVMRELSLAPGPQVGRILEKLLDEVIEDPAKNDRNRLLARLHGGLPIDTAGPSA
ncbi:MAG TPA: CCA tRNA nucleotidyltransferase [Candidatus Limnocylindrales bacterium]|nr:CCA tRNA nucleotidyltransferase [Candidatus Limnocylindrales bacterium]